MIGMASGVEPLRPMARRSSAPSARLLRAVAAERDDLERRRATLLDRSRRVQEELDEIRASVAELDERLALISRLAGEDSPPERSPEGETIAQHDSPGDGSRPVLRGPAIRATAVRVLLAHPRRPEAMHYREWFELVAQSGYAVAGKDPLAVFLTQLSRSPLVRRGTESGVYELDLQAPTHLRRQLEHLQAQLRELTATTSRSTTDLGAVRRRRTALNVEIGRVEKALEEAEETLRNTPETPGLAAAG
jgi:chaperonin cofactor prefoldin